MDNPFLTVHGFNIYKSGQDYHVEEFEGFVGTLQETIDLACGRFCLDFIPDREKLERFIGLLDPDEIITDMVNSRHLIN